MPVMAEGFFKELSRYTRDFFSNWAESDASVAGKVRQTVRNRWRGAVTGEWCCGNYGAPGC